MKRGRKPKDPKELSVFRRYRLGLLTSEESVVYKKYQNEWSRRNYKTASGRAKAMFGSARRASKKNNLQFNLTKEWIEEKIERGACEVSGLPFVMDSMNTGKHGAGSQHPFGPSLDKTDRTRGYTQDNVKVVVWLYNLGKHIYSHEDFMLLARALVTKEFVS